MNSGCETLAQQLCGCCAGIGTETPELIYNRPALSQISYRVGRHATFKTSLLAALSDSNLLALAPLRTRDDSDFTIALLDAWALSLDILTFYQERLATESYLGTAADNASVNYLAQLVGYQPSPGVAASAFLAFTLSDAPGSPDNVLIPAGTRVQSVPRPGQTPQVFETSADLTGLIELNAVTCQTSIPWGLNPGSTSIWLQGTANNIHVGDGILFVSQSLNDAAESGSTSASGVADFHFVTSVSVDSNYGTTFVEWDQGLTQSWPISNDNTAYLYVFRKKAALFGSQAPDPRTMNSTTQPNLNNLTGWPENGNGDWVFGESYQPGSLLVNLDSTYSGLTPPQNGEPEWVVFIAPDVTLLYQVIAAADQSPDFFTLTNRVTQVKLGNQQLLFQHFQPATNLTQLEQAVAEAIQNIALDYFLGRDPSADIIALNQALAALQLAQTPVTSDQVLAHLVGETRTVTAYVQSDPLTPAGSPLTGWDYDDTYTKQMGMLAPVEGSSVAVMSSGTFSQNDPVAIFGKRLRLQVTPLTSAPAGSQPGFVPNGANASQPLLPGQVFLIDAFPPQQSPNQIDFLWSVLTTDGVAGTLQISDGNLLLIPADKNDPVVSESAVISGTSFKPIQTLTFTQSLARIYDRSTATLNANVVAGTNGETMHELLGSGDATNDALQFTVKQSPLTYVTSPLNLGAVSTLQVWVNNLRWHEVENFLASGPNDRVFVTRADSSGQVTVQFGDGVEGARTPTGQMNIRAVYRKGIGAAGNVDSGQLSQALDRPQGLKAVTNPDQATGGADPDSAADARVSAPLHTLTLGRVVSLEDYQNYALAFAGIAKAVATWTWVGRARGVFLTVAGANGTVFEQDDQIVTSLIQALRNAGNPYVPLTVTSYKPVFFEVGANVRIDTDDYDPAQVLAQIWQSLTAAFGFAPRQPGQGVAQSEVIALMQSTPGVIAVQVTAFNRRGQPTQPGAPLPAVLRASAPIPGTQGTPQGAEILLIDPASQGAIAQWS